nr:hypothetical protein 1634Bnrm1_p006 [Cryptomonas sp.]
MTINKKKYKLFIKYLKEEMYFVDNKKNRREIHHCNISRKNLVSKTFGRCKICSDFDISFDILSSHVNYKCHFDFHSHKNVNYIYIPIFNINWIYEEEILFSEGIENYGLANWENISRFMGTKNLAECEKHFLEIYFSTSQKNFVKIRRLFPSVCCIKIYSLDFQKMLKTYNISCEKKVNVIIQRGEFCSVQTNIENFFDDFIVNTRIKKSDKKKTILKKFFLKLLNKIIYKKLFNENFYCRIKSVSSYLFFKIRDSLNNKSICETICFENLFCNQHKLAKEEKYTKLKRNLIFYKWLKIFIKEKFKVSRHYMIFNMKRNLFIQNQAIKKKFSNRKFSHIFYREMNNHSLVGALMAEKDKIAYLYFGIFPSQYIDLIVFVSTLTFLTFQKKAQYTPYINDPPCTLFSLEQIIMNIKF